MANKKICIANYVHLEEASFVPVEMDKCKVINGYTEYNTEGVQNAVSQDTLRINELYFKFILDI